MQIRRGVVDAIVEHARQEHPLECCGLLIGTGDEVLERRPARNLHGSPIAYLVDPKAHFEAIRNARARGLAVVGGYHSHPRTTVEPSATDIREANDSLFVHMIVSLAGSEPHVAAFRIAEGRAIRLTLSIDG